MEASGVIECVDASPWSPTSLQPSRRTAVYASVCTVDKELILDRYPLPTKDQMIAKLTGSTVFSKIDLLRGYLQLPLASDSRYLIAFVTHEVCVAVQVGQQVRRRSTRSSERFLRAWMAASALWTTSSCTIVRWQSTSVVCVRLVQYNATINRGKCFIGVPEVEFNGHSVSGAGSSRCRPTSPLS